MKSLSSLLSILAVLILIIALIGCAARKETARRGEPSRPLGPVASEQAEQAPAPPKVEEEQQPIETPPYVPPPPPKTRKEDSQIVDPVEQRKIKDAALTFAENIPRVKHVKICYVKHYANWFLYLYIQGKKDYVMQQYGWNQTTGEWDLVGGDNNLPTTVPEDRLKFHLETELTDETCYVLK